MATRFYLPSSGNAAVSPAFTSSWEDTSIAGARLRCVTVKSSTSSTVVSFADANSTDKDVLFRQYVSDPLDAQTISAQTLKLQIRARERLAGNNLFVVIGAKVVSNDGQSVTGTLLATTRDATEVVVSPTAYTNRQFSATTTGVACNEGDRIVIEVGLAGDPANSGGADHDGDLMLGDSAVSDLAENDTSTADDNPWVEFQNTVTFRDVDYKFIYYSVGENTTVRVRYFRGTLVTSYTRDAFLEAITETTSGALSYNQLVTAYNTSLRSYGVPISEQT